MPVPGMQLSFILPAVLVFQFQVHQLADAVKISTTCMPFVVSKGNGRGNEKTRPFPGATSA
jgi:hypothetical protein